MKFLITGGCGFLGSNLGAEVLSRHNELIVFDNLYRSGTAMNLDWLRSLGNFSFIHGDIRSQNDIESAIIKHKPDVVFHLAGQVAMTTSIENPKLDFETNVVGSHNLLEAVRKHSPKTIVTYSSTNKVYGDLEHYAFKETPTRYICNEREFGFDESTLLDFHSPYGTSKGAADQYMLDYCRIFGLQTIVFRHSSIFGDRQFSTFDQGWIGWFVQKAIDRKNKSSIEPFTINGNGKQVRDVVFASDMVNCYFSAIQHIDQTKGQAFNIGGGPTNSFSLLELFLFLESELNVKMNYRQLDWRQGDQKIFIADIRKAERLFNWTPKVTKEAGIRRMIKWVEQQNA